MFAALLLPTACNVYDQELIDGAQGGPGTDGAGAEGGTSTGGQTGGGVAGSGGLVVGGSSTGGSASGGRAQGGAGRGGGDEGGTSTGATSGSGQGGSSRGGGGGVAGSSGLTGQGGSPGGSGTAGNAGSGAGTGGGAGSAGGGTGGAGNGGAGAGGAGSGGTGTGGAGGGASGTGGSGEVCSGCARLSVPLAASGDKAHFTIALPTATDFSNATISFRVARLAGTGGWFKGYIQEGSPNFLYQDSVQTTIASIGTSMQTITWDVATAGTTANKTIIQRIGVEISGGGASSWTSPTVITIDSITVTNTTLTMSSFTFDASNTVYPTPTSSGPLNVIWLNNYSGDTNVTGAALSWLGP